MPAPAVARVPRHRCAGRAGLLFSVVAAWIGCALPDWEPDARRAPAPVPGALRVGAVECLLCHEEVQGHPKIAGYHADCESCHGPGSVHVDVHVGEVAGDEAPQRPRTHERPPLQLPGRQPVHRELPFDIRYPANADCLRCHAVGRATHLDWGTGEHARAGLACSDCHNPHATTKFHLREATSDGLLRPLDAASRLCVECHEDVAAALTYPSHHPVGEGAMSCLSCHDPHEDRRVSLGGEDRVCATCHQDITGPWVFEHLAVEEGCGSCHDPHGALSDKLLHTAEPVLCLSCHSLNDLWHHDASGTGFLQFFITQDRPTDPPQIGQEIGPEAVTFLNRCTDCHGAIHGSYTDEHLRH